MENKGISERVTDSKTIYAGKIVNLLALTVELPNGKLSQREVVRHPGAVAVLAELPDGKLICVEQYRTAPGQVLLEIPAGKLEPGELPADCANRELEEETGYRAGNLQEVADFYTSPGFADERIHLYYATDLQEGQIHPDDDEFVQTQFVSRRAVADAVEHGQIHDAKTLLAMLWWLNQGGVRS